MGTSELTTGELTFSGAIAYPVGPLEKGVANVVGIVLTYSRLTVGLSAAAYMTRAAREAQKYAEFRDAFGLMIGQFPLVAVQIKENRPYDQKNDCRGFQALSGFSGAGRRNERWTSHG